MLKQFKPFHQSKTAFMLTLLLAVLNKLGKIYFVIPISNNGVEY